METIKRCTICGAPVVNIPYYHFGGASPVCENCTYLYPITKILDALGARLEDPLIVDIDTDHFDVL